MLYLGVIQMFLDFIIFFFTCVRKFYNYCIKSLNIWNLFYCKVTNERELV